MKLVRDSVLMQNPQEVWLIYDGECPICRPSANAQHVLAMIGTTNDWINRLNVILFRSKFTAAMFYPVMRSIRNIVLRIKGIAKINNLEQSDE